MKENNSKVYQAALYLRLSKEDGDVEDGGKLVSNSISNQKDLIMDYLKQHPEIQVHSIWADDGYSGVNFNRPNFQNMLEEIKCGDVNCVIVKDLSRFGRNYIETGRYIEKIFPLLGVRFIAVTDNYDSLDKNGGFDMIIPFKNLMNDAYSRDISVKIRSNMAVKRNRGEYIGAFAVYGYLKSQEDKNRLVADEYASGVVRDIFRMKISGIGQQDIADRLNHEGILSPLAYKWSIGIPLETPFYHTGSAKWTYVAVTRILQNEIYTGVLLQGKQSTPNYKIKTRFNKPETEWSRVENAHEAIVSRTDFELVQELLKADTRRSPIQSSVYPFAGLLYCADCMESMVRKTVPAGGRKYVYYVCSGNKRDKAHCSAHRISEQELMNSVLSVIRLHIDMVLGLSGAMEMIENSPLSMPDVSKCNLRIQKKHEELKKAERRKMNLYEDFKDGILTKEEYSQLKREYSRQTEEAERAIEAYQAEIEQMAQKKGSRQEWIKKYKELGTLESLDRNTVATLVRKIKVYEGRGIEIDFIFAEEAEQYREMVELYSGQTAGREAI